MTEDEPSRDELEAAHCWEADDRAGSPAMTAFRRRARLHQARWRDANGHPVGTQPIRPRPGKPVRKVGSRLPLDYATETGAQFVTANALAAVKARSAYKERHQSWDAQRLWADLLWPTALACNLFGDLVADPARADRAVHAWWPDIPGTVREVRLFHSPGRLDRDWLGTLVDWSAACYLDLGDGDDGIVAVAVAYSDKAAANQAKPERLARYLQVAERSGAFQPGAAETVDRTDLLEVWIQHLLVHSMLQHPESGVRWGRLVVVHPEGNVDYTRLCDRYRGLLRDDDTTFASTTLEAMLAADALPRASRKALRERYLLA